MKRPYTLQRTALLATALGSLLLTQACQKTEPEPEFQAASPATLEGDMIAFRSTLDNRARMLTVRQPDDIKLAYDVETGNLHQAWRGTVHFTGAVFDTRHGPQPVSEGDLYLTQDARWQTEGASVQYGGHRYSGEQLALRYDVEGDGWSATVWEKPSARLEEQNLIITREFAVNGLPKGLGLTLTDLAEAADQTLVGSGEWQGSQTLRLKNGVTRVQRTFTDPTRVERPDEAGEGDHPGQTLVEGSDCAACHNPEIKTVGPSYQSIAERYDNTPENRTMLAEKIILGGAGNWGDVPMSPHPDLSQEDAEQMVDYIFSLQEETEGETRWNLDQPATDTLELVAETPADATGNGALVYRHRFSGDQPNIESLRGTAPSEVARISRIHFPDKASFKPLDLRFALQVKTHLKVDEALETELRLISDDGAVVYLNDELLIDSWGFHGPEPEDASVTLEPGLHALEVIHFQSHGGATLSMQWRNPETGEFEIIPAEMLQIQAADRRDVVPVITDPERVKTIPGDQTKVAGVHPAFDRFQARPDEFEPMVGGIDFLPDGRMVITTWDPEGSVYIVSDYDKGPEQASVKRIARGLAEPLGVKVVDGDIYVLQKQELTRLEDVNGDEVIDVYHSVSADWSVTDNFHEFAFGLEYEDGHFYGTLATAILSGGASADPQAPDRGKAIKIRKTDGQVEFVAHGLRTPNGIGFGVDGELFIADNQGDWLPSSKIVELTPGAWYGSRSVDFEGTADLTETKPVVWLPQDEIGNSPSEPAPLNVGPYQNQMIHGEVTHGGIKRVYAERVNGRLQGAVFRFIQGLEAGVNRLDWAPDGSLIVGGVGNPGNWADGEKQWYGLERLVYNGETAFEMLSVSARSDGFVIEFTEPVKAGQNISPEDFEILQWYYEPTAEYGGPKKNVTELPVEGFALSEDRKRVSFKLGGLKPDHVVYFRIARPFVSETDNSLWTTEAWYTLNAIPEDQPVALEGRQPQHNQLTETEQAEGWELLFDGKTLNGLRNYNAETLGERWVVDDGALHMQANDGRPGGDVVITDEPLASFELYLEWKLARNGNSGIIYSVDESPELEAPYMSGPEYQLLDNIGHPDSEIYTHRAADLYDLIAATPVTVNPAGEWNRTRLVVDDGRIEHWLNGFKVVETEMGTPEWEAMIAESKFADWEAFAATPEGHVVLQDHDDPVWFRNIKLRELP
ncbi:DUF1080 domain-containing protein [Marinimicrobium sp. C6131]|uniref:family 16 glycoside hydrolase n=1 Tax=Marinimicrobium sp. C6131 TaxID=3022676 RepID=UPI00223D63D6|nr:family 16 glycoside hydrolase [Marinimicrobium sp. C6131]UZJ43785.1 DUF1080 domain-containing protein [Marinimicrobium sp. C6131]